LRRASSGWYPQRLLPGAKRPATTLNIIGERQRVRIDVIVRICLLLIADSISYISYRYHMDMDHSCQFSFLQLLAYFFGDYVLV
jgi:hypothetical protein